MNEIEMNRVIGRYMGLTVVGRIDGDVPTLTIEEAESNGVHVAELNYHTDYNLLMPVAKRVVVGLQQMSMVFYTKLRNRSFADSLQAQMTVDTLDRDYNKCFRHIQYMKDAALEGNISELHRAVYNAIVFLNDVKSKG